MSKMARVKYLLSTCLVALLTACFTPQVPKPQASFLVISPGSFILTNVGESIQLTAQVIDDQGNAMEDANISWSTSDSSQATINQNGLVTSATNLGSVQITATANGISSAPILGLLAKPVEGAILIGDDNVQPHPSSTNSLSPQQDTNETILIEPVDPKAEYGLGFQYRVALAGIAPPAIGSVLMTTGELPIGGKVVDAIQVEEVVTVTLEVIPLDEMFDDLTINESIKLLNAELDLNDEIKEVAKVTKQQGGGYEILLSPQPPSLHPSQVTDLSPDLIPNLLDCKVEASVPVNPLLLLYFEGGLKLKLEPDMSFNLNYSTEHGLQKLAVTGEPKVTVELTPKMRAAFDGKLDCRLEIGQINLPIGGPAALIFGGWLPYGAGFELSAKTTFADVGVKLKASATARTEFGYCDSGSLVATPNSCENMNSFSMVDSDLSAKPLLPNPIEQFRVEIGAYAFAYTGLDIGNPIIKSLGFKTVDLRLGVSQSFNMSPTKVQVNNSDSRSSYDLSFLINAKTGADFAKFLDFFKVTAAKFDYKIPILLGTAPSGTFSITPNTVKAGTGGQLGDFATFNIDIDQQSNGLFTYGEISKIEIFWLKDDGTPNGTLASARPGCSTLTASQGQLSFSCQADFLESHIGQQAFYAFAWVELLGQELNIPLELNKNAKATVTVSEPDADPCPDGTELSPAQTCDDPDPIEPFEILSVSYIRDVVSDEPATRETTVISYSGDPVFPIRVIARPRSCPESVTCGTFVKDEDNLPIDIHGFTCKDNTDAPIEFDYEIILVSNVNSSENDQSRQTAPYPTPWTCLPAN